MSASDDYPLGRIPVSYTINPGLWHKLCDELDSLRAKVIDLESAADDRCNLCYDDGYQNGTNDAKQMAKEASEWCVHAKNPGGDT